ncbi:MAG: hypothetical protein WCC44_02190 [Azonexus sp.]
MTKFNEPNLLLGLRHAGAAPGLNVRSFSTREVRRAEQRAAAKAAKKKSTITKNQGGRHAH